MNVELTPEEVAELAGLARRVAAKRAADADRHRKRESFALAREWEERARVLHSAADKLDRARKPGGRS